MSTYEKVATGAQNGRQRVPGVEARTMVCIFFFILGDDFCMILDRLGLGLELFRGRFSMCFASRRLQVARYKLQVTGD